MPVIHFATQSYPSKSAPVDSQRVINMYAEQQPQDAKSQIAVFGCPGLQQFGKVGNGPIRGMHVMDNVLYVVSGVSLYSVDSAGNGTLLGTDISGTSQVSMDDNNHQLIIVNGFGGWIYCASVLGTGAAAQAILGGDTQSNIATNLSTLVNNNSTLSGDGVLSFSSNSNLYLFSPTALTLSWSAVNGTTDTLIVSSFGVETAVIGGSVAASGGDSITLTATSTGISNSPVSVEYITVAGDTTTTISAALAIQLNVNGNLAAAGITAFSSGSEIYIFKPSTLTVGWGSTVSGSETVTYGTGNASKAVVGGHTSSGDSLQLKATLSGPTVITLNYNVQTNGTITSVVSTNNGFGYNGQPPYVLITDSNGQFAAVSAVNNNGGITSYTVNQGGSGYINPQVQVVNTLFANLITTNLNFNVSNSVTYFDNYFVFNKTGTNEFFLSFLNDGTQYSGLDIAQAEVHSGNILKVLNDHELLYLFCQRHIETWYDAGTADFPFQRYNGATVERGLGAANSVAQQDQAIFFLGDDKIYYRLQAPLPIRVSTHGVEEAWSKYPTTDDCEAFTYVWEGHRFITLNFPSAWATWVFDVTSGIWHERESLDANNNPYPRWRGNSTPQFQVYDEVLIGDAFSGLIGSLSDTVYTEYGNTMVGMAVSTPVHSDRQRLFMSRFELDVETGVGLPHGQGSDPQIMLEWSDDGGRIFKGLQLWRSMGKLGKYVTRLRWLRMGSFRQRIFRITISDPVKRTIIAANADTVKGTN